MPDLGDSNMTVIKPHPMAEIWRPDEIAECTSVNRETYGELWRLVSHYEHKAPCCPGELDRSMSAVTWWSELTPTAQADVNRALTALDKEM